MISGGKIKELATKFQTRKENILREYIQHLFLSNFYKQKGTEKVPFKGGTALKIIYQSPRFSEDLDFSSENFSVKRKIEEVFINTLSEMTKENLKVELKESKFTSGGYLGIIVYDLYSARDEIIFEVSFRRKRGLEKETTTIISEYCPPYVLTYLSSKEMVREKTSALLERQKPRDFYDLYYILRHPVLNKFLVKNNLKKIKEILLKKEINFKRELEVLLPISHHQILKNFRSNFLFEIEKFL